MAGARYQMWGRLESDEKAFWFIITTCFKTCNARCKGRPPNVFLKLDWGGWQCPDKKSGRLSLRLQMFQHQFRIEEEKVFMDPKGTFPISIAIKGIGISCSAGFQQPFWKLIGFDPVWSGEEMTGGGSW